MFFENLIAHVKLHNYIIYKCVKYLCGSQSKSIKHGLFSNLTSIHVFTIYQSMLWKWIFVNMIGEKWYFSVFAFLLLWATLSILSFEGNLHFFWYLLFIFLLCNCPCFPSLSFLLFFSLSLSYFYFTPSPPPLSPHFFPSCFSFFLYLRYWPSLCFLAYYFNLGSEILFIFLTG